MNCKNCGKELATDANFCENCGALVSFNCPNCGAAQNKSTNFCAKCGTATGMAESEETNGTNPTYLKSFKKKNKWVVPAIIGTAAIVLAVALVLIINGLNTQPEKVKEAMVQGGHESAGIQTPRLEPTAKPTASEKPVPSVSTATEVPALPSVTPNPSTSGVFDIYKAKILPESSVKVYSDQEIMTRINLWTKASSYTAAEVLAFARNEIYANHHCIFEKANTKNYFYVERTALYGQAYNDKAAATKEFNAYEKGNISVISKLEDANSPAASTNPQTSISPQTNTIEQKIRKALSSKGTVLLCVSNDFSFENAQGVRTTGSNGSITASSALEKKTSENILLTFLYKKIIRIENGKVSMDDADFRCQLSASANGISIHITRGNSSSVNQGEMNGTITGNTLSGNVEVSSLTVVNHQSNGYTATGSLRVSIQEIKAGELPPKPPVSLRCTKNSDNTITLTWEDPNPKGTVASYEIYCSYGVLSGYKSVATVKKSMKWTDTASVLSTLKYDSVDYYIIAHGANGTKSKMSADVSYIFL